jgi:hypothetical protein
MSRFKNDYAPDGKADRLKVREEAGNKCIRCNHPNCKETFHILTVHHFDGDKANDAWWNKMALCQRCHLKIQNKVIPQIPYFLEHSEWIKPYVAGFYAFKYEGENLTRDEVMARLDELLAYELPTPPTP